MKKIGGIRLLIVSAFLAAYGAGAAAQAIDEIEPNYAAGTTVLITPNGTPADNTGRLRVTIHYIEITVPTT